MRNNGFGSYLRNPMYGMTSFGMEATALTPLSVIMQGKMPSLSDWGEGAIMAGYFKMLGGSERLFEGGNIFSLIESATLPDTDILVQSLLNGNTQCFNSAGKINISPSSGNAEW